MTPPTPEGHKLGFVREIQALRGIAVLLTFFAHAPGVFTHLQPLMVIHFWTGVDLFLVISGFVIAKSFFPQILLRTERVYQFKVAVAFWIRRAYRLLPASVFWAFFLLFCATFFNKSGIFATPYDVLKEIFAFLLYSKNIASIYGVNYSLGPYWSLSLEEQFYLVLPFALIFLPFIFKPKFYLPVVLGIALFPQFLSPHYHLFRFESFMVGIFIYQLHQTSLHPLLTPAFMRKAYKRWIITVWMLVTMLLAPTLMGYFPGHKLFILLPASFLVFFASFNQGFLPTDNPMGKVAAWIGDRSYSVYICHMPALLLVYELAHRYLGIDFKNAGLIHSVAAVSIAFVLTLVFASLSYWLLEKPWQTKGKQVAVQYLQRMEAV